MLGNPGVFEALFSKNSVEKLILVGGGGGVEEGRAAVALSPLCKALHTEIQYSTL